MRSIMRATAGLILMALSGSFGMVAISIGGALLRGDPFRLPFLEAPGAAPDNSPESRQRALNVIGISLLSSVAFGIVAFAALAGTGQGTAGRANREVPRIGVNPSFAVLAASGASMKLLATPWHYVPRHFAGRFGPACVLGAGSWLGLHATVAIWFSVPWFVHFFMALLSIVALAAAIPMGRTWLALQRIDLHIDEITSPVRPNEILLVRARLRARAKVRISGASLFLACVRSVNDRTPGSPSNCVWNFLYGHEEVVAGEGAFAKGDEATLAGKFILPASSPPSSPPSSGVEDVCTCWILGVLVRLPGWPDLEIAREVEVLH